MPVWIAVHDRERRGSALIGVILALALIAALGVGLVATVRIERAAATNYVLGARARFVAEAGIQRALAELAVSELDDPSGGRRGWKLSDPGAPIDRGAALSWTQPDDGRVPCSGVLGGTLSDRGDRYSVRVIDTSAKLDLNARVDFVGPALDALGHALATWRARSGRGPDDVVRGRGGEIAALVGARGGMTSVRELEPVIGHDDAAILSDFVTAHAVRDPATATIVGRDERGYPIVAREPRAAVCVNTAPWPVLVAVFSGVTGGDAVPVSFEQAETLATCIEAWRESAEADRGPITTWDAFTRLLNGAGSAARLTPAQKDAVLANANPNLCVGELNPDAVDLRLGNSGALLRRTTELSLIASGVYEVDALGRILAADGVAAECGIRATLRVFEIARHTTQEDFARGRCEGVIAMPAPIGEPPLGVAGYVQLAPRPPRIGTGGAVLDFSSGALQPIRPGATDAQFGLAELVLDTVFPRASSRRAPGQSIGPPGPLHRDGFRAAPQARECRYVGGPPAEEGRVALWLKLGDRQDPGTILDEVREANAGWAVRARLTAVRSADGLEVAYERDLVPTRSVQGKPPAGLLRSLSHARLGGFGSAHEWHRVDMTWRDYTDQRLMVDSVRVERRDPPSVVPPEVVAARADAFVIGGSLDGRPSLCDATIDGVVIEGGSGSGESPDLDRYGLEGRSTGRFSSNFGPFEQEVVLGTLSWTALQPRSWGRVVFRNDDFALVVAVANQGGSIRLAGDGSPQKCGSGDGGGGGSDGGRSGGVGGDGGANARTAQASSPTGLRNGLASSSAPNVPRIVHRLGLVDYTFDFLYDRAALAARGVVPPPLAVSPVLEDVTLTYSTGARIIALESRD